MDNQSNFPVGKIHKKIRNMDLNEINSRTAYNKYHNEKSLLNEEQNLKDNDNLSEKTDSIHTSYQYKKNKKGGNSYYSNRSSNNQINQNQNLT